jgi:hydroxymethylpyrimidine pyrophosphatase-like HAD family hydrolase
MERYETLFRLYSQFDTETLRDYQRFVDLLPPVDSRVVLEHWEDADAELEARKDEIRTAFPESGETFADLAAHATRDQAFTGLDLLNKHGRGANVLVLDVDETLRSAGSTDNEIPRDTLHLLTEFYEAGTPIVVCTGQTLENVKGFMIQGLGNEIVHSGDLSIVYEAGTGVFTPGHGPDTKQLLYEDLSDDITDVFDRVRSRILPEAPKDLRHGVHLQGNEFNVTLKPNFETGTPEARETIDRALVYELDLLGAAVLEGLETDTAETAGDWAKAYYAEQDPEIRSVLESAGAQPGLSVAEIPASAVEVFERIDVAYYEADAAEIGSLELNKVVGVRTAFEVLGIEDPFAVVMGDSKSDLRVMEWVAEHDAGIAAAPEHSSGQVLDHVIRTDELVFDEGRAAEMLQTIYALNRLAGLDRAPR